VVFFFVCHHNECLHLLHLAVINNHLQCVKYLVEANVNIHCDDKQKRTPLIFATKNGHLSITTYLLHMGADPNLPDSSKNTPAHYAAAYGWINCLKALIQSNGSAHSPNDWKLTPLAVAILKGHLGCADLLLEEEGVDVNYVDEEGKSLVTQTCSYALDKESLSQIKYLVEKKS